MNGVDHGELKSSEKLFHAVSVPMTFGEDLVGTLVAVFVILEGPVSGTSMNPAGALASAGCASTTSAIPIRVS